MIIEKEFKKITGPVKLYAYIKMKVIQTDCFCFVSEVNWPSFFDRNKYEEFVFKGIKEAINECGYSTQCGTYTLLEIKVSKNLDESVPIAYYFAVKLAVKEFFRAKSMGTDSIEYESKGS